MAGEIISAWRGYKIVIMAKYARHVAHGWKALAASAGVNRAYGAQKAYWLLIEMYVYCLLLKAEALQRREGFTTILNVENYWRGKCSWKYMKAREGGWAFSSMCERNIWKYEMTEKSHEEGSEKSQKVEKLCRGWENLIVITKRRENERKPIEAKENNQWKRRNEIIMDVSWPISALASKQMVWTNGFIRRGGKGA